MYCTVMLQGDSGCTATHVLVYLSKDVLQQMWIFDSFTRIAIIMGAMSTLGRVSSSLGAFEVRLRSSLIRGQLMSEKRGLKSDTWQQEHAEERMAKVKQRCWQHGPQQEHSLLQVVETSFHPVFHPLRAEFTALTCMYRCGRREAFGFHLGVSAEQALQLLARKAEA